MRKIILHTATSVDGYIAGPAGEIDWLFQDQEYGMHQFFNTVDSALIGRKTFDVMLQYGLPGYDKLKNYIITSSTDDYLHLKDLHFVHENIVEFVRELKQQEGKNIWLVGGCQLNTLLLHHHLIDEIVLSIHPVILGEGIPLFSAEKGRIYLEVTDHKSFNTGLQQIHYTVAYEKMPHYF